MSERVFVVAVAARKGGVAKSTTAANVAAGLAMRGRRVLAVDADSQGHLAGLLGFSPDAAPGALFAAWVMGQPLRVSSISHLGAYSHPLALLPGGNDSLLVSLDVAGVEDLAHRLRADAAAMGAEFVVIDGPAVGQYQEFSILAADLVIAPAPCEVLGVSGALDTRALVSAIHNDLPDLPCWCLPTFYDRRLNDCRHWLAQLEAEFRSACCFPVPFRVAVRNAAARGVPVVISSKLDQSAAAYMDLVDRVLGAAGCLPGPAFEVRPAPAWVAAVAALAEA